MSYGASTSATYRQVAYYLDRIAKGIAPAALERIFERFAGPANGAGAGLGRAIVKTIATAHGGRIELESVPGEGATFTIVLPAA